MISGWVGSCLSSVCDDCCATTSSVDDVAMCELSLE